MFISTRNILWEYEDRLDIDITPGMYRASEIIDGVRMYPFAMVDCAIYYLEK